METPASHASRLRMQTKTLEKNPPSKLTIGWDIGGAHVKMVMMDANGLVVGVHQVPCPLWKGIDQLTKVISKLKPLFSSSVTQVKHAITMTGELADVFESRQYGVLAIAECLEQSLGGSLFYFALNQDAPRQSVWYAKHQLPQAWLDVASANWAASATYIAELTKEGVVVDIGSSTTDITRIQEHRLANNGMTDAGRMAAGELFYSGVVRTPIMAIAQQLPFRGQWVNVAAEHFATTADVYRLTGELAQEFDMADTADGQDKTLVSSARRLARMIGHDVEDASLSEWQQFASHISILHQEPIRRALLQTFSRSLVPNSFKESNQNERRSNLVSHLPLIAMGAGAFLVQSIAKQWHLKCISAEQFVVSEDKRLKYEAEVCFPAYAVAALLIRQGG